MSQAIIEEDNIEKGIELIQNDRAIINKVRNQYGNDVKTKDKGQAMEKVLYQMEKLYKKIIEKVGFKIQSITTDEL